MALETATYISGLVSTNPLSSDPKSQGDDHLRLIKSTILATFPNITGAVTATHTELNYVTGVTSGIQGQLNALSASVSTSTKALHLISAATASATLANAANQINWNWTLTGASGKGLSVSETAASTSGAGTQDLVSIGTLPGSTANPLRVTARGADAILVGRLGDVSVGAVGSNNALTLTTANVGSSSSGSINIVSGDTSGASSSAGSINLTTGAASGGGASFGGDITLTLGSGSAAKGKLNFVNANVANSTVACTFTANSGPTGAATSIQGWLAVKVGGTARFIPYW